jgi:hypothetical protein
MSIQVLNENEGVLNLFISGISLNIANAIRRTIISDIESLCITNVNIEYNTSCLNDQVIKQRLNLCPLLLDIDSDYSSLQLTIEKENNTESNINVTTQDIKVFDTKTNSFMSNRSLFSPDEFGNYINIVTLQPSTLNIKSGLKLIGNISSTSKDDVSDSNSVACTSTFKAHISKQKLVEIFVEQYGVTEEEANLINLDILRRKLKYDDYKDYISNTDFEFFIESVGSISNTKIFVKALDVIITKFEELLRNFRLNVTEKQLDVYINDESYTIGNILLEALSCEKVIFSSLVVYKKYNHIRLGFNNKSVVYSKEIIIEKIKELIDIFLSLKEQVN